MSSHLPHPGPDPSSSHGLAVEVVQGTETGCAVTLSGELDIVTAGGFYDALAAAIVRHGPVVALDASAVRFCDAHGIGALVRAANHAYALGGAVTVVAFSPQLGRLLAVTGLQRRFAPAPRQAPVGARPRNGRRPP